jgi:hypothetical protein
MADGHLNKCKECTKLDVANNSVDYDRTEKGVIRVIYKTQVSNSKKRECCDVTYTKVELKEWLYQNGFKCIFDKWVESGYKKAQKPSVDRLDDFKGYSFDNIRLVTWNDNHLHQMSDIQCGIGTSGRRCKKVAKKDKAGCLISVYVSYKSAVRDVGYKVAHQIKNGVMCRNGFYWSYV